MTRVSEYHTGQSQHDRPNVGPMTKSRNLQSHRAVGGRWGRGAAGIVIAGLALLAAGQPNFGGLAAHATEASTGTAPATDAGSMVLVTETTGARAYWDAGFTGKGVDVAIIDSGIAPVNGLSAPGKVILGPDLSFESQDPNTRYLDTNGHGTHLAGIVAGRDDAARGAYANDTTNFLGMAPDARILSVKVADSRGHTDVSQVIAAIDWVVQHKNDNGMNVRVLLLAFGTDSTAPWYEDPLVHAAEVAWQQGIFVVVSAGNDGPGQKHYGTVADPAVSPNLVAVGAADTAGTIDLRDDFIPDFSSGGSKLRRVDLVAPGTHIISLKSPGSYIAQNFGATGAYGDRFFRGSGTSQAAAVLSGAAALVIQQHPTISPDELKQLVTTTAQNLTHETKEVQGNGELNLSKALSRSIPAAEPDPSREWSSGIGPVDAARGSYRLVHDGVTLAGEIDIFGHSFDSKTMGRLEAAVASWSGGSWNSNQWTSSSWSASSWSSSSWSSSSWSSSSWSASSWSASSWSSSSWSASSWSSSSWSASSWSASSWSSSSWSSAGWR